MRNESTRVSGVHRSRRRVLSRAALCTVGATLASTAVPAAADDPTWFPPEVLTVAPGENAHSALAVVDLDGDTLPDVLEMGSTRRLVYRRGLGDGSFALEHVAIGAGAGLSRDVHAVVDLDDDGDTDIASTVEVFVNDGTGSFTAVSAVGLPSAGLLNILPIRLGGDALTDLIGYDSQAGVSRIYRNLGNLTFTEIGTIDGARVVPENVGDVTGDGLDDLVVTVWRDGFAVAVYRQVNGGAFELRHETDSLGFASRTSGALYAPALGDADGDGDLDAYFLERVLVNDGTGTLTPGPPDLDTWPMTLGSAPLRIADVDNDGLADAVGIDRDGAVLVSLRDENGFRALPAIPHDADNDPFDFVVGDVDVDGRCDVVVALRSPSQLVIFRQSGGPPPSVDTLTPGVVTEAGELGLTLTGSELSDETVVDFGAVAAFGAVSNATPAQVEFTAEFQPGVGGGRRPYVVRNPDGQVSGGEIELRSLVVAPKRGRLRAVVEPARDVLRLEGTIERTSLSPVGTEDSAAALRDEGLTLTVGDLGGRLEIAIPAGDPGWRERSRGRVLEWRTAGDVFPRVRLRVKVKNGRFKLKVSHYDHPDASPEDAQIGAASGTDVGAAATEWTPSRSGRRYRFRNR